MSLVGDMTYVGDTLQAHAAFDGSDLRKGRLHLIVYEYGSQGWTPVSPGQAVRLIPGQTTRVVEEIRTTGPASYMARIYVNGGVTKNGSNIPSRPLVLRRLVA
jgi:hypothetical protein